MAPGTVTECTLSGSIFVKPELRSQSSVAAMAARPDPLRPVTCPSGRPTSTKQSPPMPVMCGSVMHRTAAAVTAASAALPPRFRTSSAASVACGEDVAAMPLTP